MSRRVVTVRQHSLMEKIAWPLPHLLMHGFVAASGLLFAGEAQYTYDNLGRLSAVADEAGNTAVYTYDAVWNLLAIDPFTPRQ
jgi:hypothetical protein